MNTKSLVELLREARDYLFTPGMKLSADDKKYKKAILIAADELEKKEDVSVEAIETLPYGELRVKLTKGICTCGRGWNELNHDYNSQPKNRQGKIEPIIKSYVVTTERHLGDKTPEAVEQLIKTVNELVKAHNQHLED